MVQRIATLFMVLMVLNLATLAPPLLAAGNVHAADVNRSDNRSPRSAAATVQAETRCLNGDPYRLDQLVKIVGSPNPPRTPVKVGPGLVVEFVRAANMVDRDDSEMPRVPSVDGAAQPAEPPLERSTFAEVPLRLFNTRTKLEYRVTMSDAMLREIYTCHQRTGRTDAGGRAEPGVVEGTRAVGGPPAGGSSQSRLPFGGVIQAGWSNGDDSRIVRTPTTQWPWRAITQSSWVGDGDEDLDQSRCSMTLIGPRHLITAAHCLVNFGTDNWKTRELAPGRDGEGVLPYGSSQMTTSPPPGVEAWYLVPDPWLDSATTYEWQWDIGLVLMVDRLGEQTGWMGYGAYTANVLDAHDHWNRGYPGCQDSYEERPDGDDCQRARLYGDTDDCEIDDYHHPGSNGWNRMFSFGCDMGRGHSGSPVYHYRTVPTTGQLGPYVIAVASSHECTTCDVNEPNVDEAFPNHARRITPWMLGNVSWLREIFP